MEAHFVINYHHKFQVSTILYSVFYIISRNPFFFLDYVEKYIKCFLLRVAPCESGGLFLKPPKFYQVRRSIRAN